MVRLVNTVSLNMFLNGSEVLPERNRQVHGNDFQCWKTTLFAPCRPTTRFLCQNFEYLRFMLAAQIFTRKCPENDFYSPQGRLGGFEITNICKKARKPVNTCTTPLVSGWRDIYTCICFWSTAQIFTRKGPDYVLERIHICCVKVTSLHAP